LAGGGPLHRLTHVRESPEYESADRLIDQERDEQDAAQGEPDRRRVLTVPDAKTEPPERADYACHNRGDDQAKPDSEWEFGHEETRWGHQAPRDDRQHLCRRCATQRNREMSLYIQKSGPFL
jgi:hypothetical protein